MNENDRLALPLVEEGDLNGTMIENRHREKIETRNAAVQARACAIMA